VGDAKAVARGGIDEAPRQRFARRECDRMHEDVEAVPMRLQVAKAARDVLIAADIHCEGKLRAQLRGERLNSIGHAFDI
jgi:hypothetical protein